MIIKVSARQLHLALVGMEPERATVESCLKGIAQLTYEMNRTHRRTLIELADDAEAEYLIIRLPKSGAFPKAPSRPRLKK